MLTLNSITSKFWQLKDVRSTDKSQTLLHYLAKLMKERYSHLMDFYEDLDVTIDKGGKNCFQISLILLFDLFI